MYEERAFSCASVVAGQRKTPTRWLADGGFDRCLAVTYSHMGNPTLQSALTRFTAVFGMGTGGSKSLEPPGKLVGSTGL